MIFALLISSSVDAIAKRKKQVGELGKITSITDISRDKVVCFALYTLHENTLKITGQLFPLEDGEPTKVSLEIMKDGKWERIQEKEVIAIGWTVPFRVENWDSTKDYKYRINHADKAFFEGVIRKDPVNKEKIKVAVFTGNSSRDLRMKPELIQNLKHQDPDLLFFSGDQVYDHEKHYQHWIHFGMQFREIMKDRPTITIPDDHDVGMPNIWGENGKKSNKYDGTDGGYRQPVEYVKMVERAQTSHLPDAYDPKPIQRGIGTYFTDLTWGRISFAIIEDRKFKTGPHIVKHKGPKQHIITDENFKPEDADIPGAVLLGDRQLKFLREWGTDWKGADMKSVLSATIFAQGHTKWPMDTDGNGWPQTGRNKALDEIRKSYSVMLSGDQHLATVIHHGINDWNDAGYSFCVPSIVNFFPRYWKPAWKANKAMTEKGEFAGEYLDAFHNKITMLAYGNPGKEREKYGEWGENAEGHGLVVFDKKTRQITFECWSRGVDVSNPEHKQYPGWPITISQFDNYGRKATAWLPTIKVTGVNNPVFQVINESNGKVEYTIRINGNEYRPKVFALGKYTLKVSEPDSGKLKTIENINANNDDSKSLNIILN